MNVKDRIELSKRLVHAYRVAKLKTNKLSGDIKEMQSNLEDEVHKEDGSIEAARNITDKIVEKRVEKRSINGAKKEAIEKLFEVIMGEGEYDEDQLGLFDVIGDGAEEEE